VSASRVRNSILKTYDENDGEVYVEGMTNDDQRMRLMFEVLEQVARDPGPEARRVMSRFSKHGYHVKERGFKAYAAGKDFATFLFSEWICEDPRK
jgi:hypothetical protein